MRVVEKISFSWPIADAQKYFNEKLKAEHLRHQMRLALLCSSDGNADDACLEIYTIQNLVKEYGYTLTDLGKKTV